MENPLQALEFNGIGNYLKISSGSITGIIQIGDIDYHLGRVAICFFDLGCATIKEIFSIKHVSLKEVYSEDIIGTGFSKIDSLIDDLAQYYSEYITINTPLTIVRWR